MAFTPASASTRSRLASHVSTSAAPRAASTSASRPATGLDQIHHAWSPQAPASFPAVQHPYTYTVCPLSQGPLGALHLSSAIKPMSNTGYRSASPRIKHREQTSMLWGQAPRSLGQAPPLPRSLLHQASGANLYALGSSPTFVGSCPPPRSLPCSNHHLVSKASEATLHASGQTPSLVVG